MNETWRITGAIGLPWPAVDLDEAAFLAEVHAESIGWLPMGDGAYLHLGNSDEEELVITVVGVPGVSMAGMNVMLLG